MWFYNPEYLRQARKLCDQYGIILIFDEIAIGFWRTGKYFAWEHAGVMPDIMCIGKGLTAGYMTMAAVLATAEIARAISEGEAGVLMHGPTYMGNPLACAIAIESLRLLRSQNMAEKIGRIEQIMKEELSEASGLQGVTDIRVLGSIGVVEVSETVDVGKFQKICVAKNVWIRPFGRNVYIMPPYVISEGQLRTLCRRLVEIVRDGGIY